MGLTVVFTALVLYGVYLLLYLSDIYNIYIFDRMVQNVMTAELELEFDYIIVGGGTAGSLLATKMLDKNVLLLEAGTSVNFIPELPIFGPIWQGSNYDWNYVTEPQQHACKALNNQQSRWPRGKVLGGTHLLSNLIQVAGEPEEYREYVDSRQSSFDYETDIGQYFREYEALMEPQVVPFRTEFSRLLKLAGSEIQFGGFSFHHPNVSVRNGFRFTTASLYRTVQGQQLTSNHTIAVNAMVNRLLLCSDSSHVEGVEFTTKSGERVVAKARKKVILTAGAIGSPAILLRSGIGPKKELEELDIETVVDLPSVGKHLRDHVATGLDLVTLNSTVGTGLLDVVSMDNLYKFLWQDEGLIAMPGCDLIGSLKVLNGSKHNDLQFMVIPMALNSDSGLHLRKILNIKDEVYFDYFHNQEDERQSVTILPVVMKPKSEGELRLRTRDPQDPPIIDPNYLSHPDDKRVLYKGIRIIQRLVETKSLQKLGAKIKDTPFPGCEGHTFDSEAYWLCYIEQLTMTSYHPAGTCRMGDCPEDSVVDYHFKVHGVDNLYVVDASVMPQLPAANPIATINMLALRFFHREIE